LLHVPAESQVELKILATKKLRCSNNFIGARIVTSTDAFLTGKVLVPTTDGAMIPSGKLRIKLVESRWLSVPHNISGVGTRGNQKFFRDGWSTPVSGGRAVDARSCPLY